MKKKTAKKTMFDFRDRNGPVPAHRHPNGGGWVAETATVEDSVFVGPGAQVFGNAQVFENAQVFGNAWIYGDVRVFGDSRVWGSSRLFGDVLLN